MLISPLTCSPEFWESWGEAYKDPKSEGVIRNITILRSCYSVLSQEDGRYLFECSIVSTRKLYPCLSTENDRQI